jgi:hypothetical protein
MKNHIVSWLMSLVTPAVPTVSCVNNLKAAAAPVAVQTSICSPEQVTESLNKRFQALKGKDYVESTRYVERVSFERPLAPNESATFSRGDVITVTNDTFLSCEAFYAVTPSDYDGGSGIALVDTSTCEVLRYIGFPN